MTKPRPKIAFLTNGTRWKTYFVGLYGITEIEDCHLPKDLGRGAEILHHVARPVIRSAETQATFKFLEEIELRLAIRENTPDHRYLLKTAQALLLPSKLTAEEPVASALVKKIPRAKAVLPLTTISPTSTTFKFTKVRGNFGDESITNWSGLCDAALRAAVKAGMSHDEIWRISQMNIREGNVTDSGYSPVDGINLSVQAKDADGTWQAVRTLAERLRVSVSLTITGSNKAIGLLKGTTHTLVLPPYK